MVELLQENNSCENKSVMEFIPNSDPIAMFFMIPILPAMLIMKFHMTMLNQLSLMSPVQQNTVQQKTKITSITRTGNTLDIIEKWV